jgi:hypothetical protein
MEQLDNSNNASMTDSEYETWLRDFRMTVDSRLSRGARLPLIPEEVWKYWEINAQTLSEGQDDISYSD